MIGKSNQIPVLLLCVLILCGLGAGTPCFGDLGTIHLKEGKSVTVEIVAADRGQVLWKADNKPETKTQPYFRDQIDYVDFPSTDIWTQAENAFESGKIDEAITLYRQVIANRAFNFYPIPGNFASLAQVRLLNCYRIKMNQAAIVKQAETVRNEFLNLPPDFRKFHPVIECWKAISKQKWEAAIAAIDKEDPPSAEGFLLRGMALEALGKKDEAVQSYAGAYVLNFGGPVNIAKQALQRSAAILAKSGDKDRKNEIQAQAKIYRDLFGKGELWKGAPEWLVKLADDEIVTLGKADPMATAKGTSGDNTVVVTEKIEVAALPDPDERDWVLVSELPHKIYIKGIDPNEKNFVKVGGVSQDDDGYVFDGTGGGIRLSGIDTNNLAFLFQLTFIADSTEGAIFDLNNARGAKGGFGVYLKEGQLQVTWTTRGLPSESWSAGEVKVGQMYQFTLSADQSANINYRLGSGKNSVAKKPKGMLKIANGLTACIGDTKASDKDEATADGEGHTPFKGKILHLSIGTGKTAKEILDKETAQFGGKKVRLNPPE